jgi:hypothetical protein
MIAVVAAHADDLGRRYRWKQLKFAEPARFDFGVLAAILQPRQDGPSDPKLAIEILDLSKSRTVLRLKPAIFHVVLLKNLGIRDRFLRVRRALAFVPG